MIGFSVILIAVAVLTSGCIQNPTEIQIKEVEIPSDLNEGLNGIISDLSAIYDSQNNDIAYLAEKIGKTDDISKIKEICYGYYAGNPILNCLVYCDKSGDMVEVPVQVDKNLFEFIPYPTEEDLEKNNGRIHLFGKFVPDYGYVNANYGAVYDSNGEYKGCIILIYDLYISINLHPSLTGKEKPYGDFICFIVDDDGKIIYSSSQEAIGLKVLEGKSFSNGICVISAEKEYSGAYQYTSRAFYNYLASTKSEKVTAWKKMNINGEEQTVYLVKENNMPEIQYENVYEINTENAIKNVEDIYSYANAHGKEAAMERVNNGHYGYDVYIMDMTGTIISSAYNDYIGLNYLNNRGVNGYSYVGGAITTAKQGGGFIYYIFPIAGTVDTNAGQCSFAYIFPIDDDCFIFGNFPGGTNNIKTGSLIRTTLEAVSREILIDANSNGVQYVIDEINSDPEHAAEKYVQNLKIPISDILIMDYSGVVYTSTMHPNEIGETLTKYTDLYGGSTIRKAITLARNGGGFMPDLSASDKEGYVDMWTMCVAPINDEYLTIVVAYSGTNNNILTSYI